MSNNYFIDHTGFTSILKGKLPLKFTLSDIKLHEIEKSTHHMKNIVGTTTLKEINTNIFYIMFPRTFDREVMRWYNTIDLYVIVRP